LQKVSSARAPEAPIQNLVRPRGAAHYGLGRTLHVLFDILTIRFLPTHCTCPMHFFGRFGLPGTGLNGGIPGYLAGALLLPAGLMMFSTGLLGEVMIRSCFESPGHRIYAVRAIRCRRGHKAPSEAR
jgi:hypothetical protein